MRQVSVLLIVAGCAAPASDAIPILPDGGPDAPETSAPECAPGLQLCSAQCADVSSDPRNCGACGVSCPSMSTCIAGQCFVNDPQP